MPHCIIEYSHDITIKASALMCAVYEGALASNLFEENHIKTRAIAYEHYQKGAEKDKFIHISTRILSGRTLEQRMMLSNKVLKKLVALGLKSVTITVEVIEMERESYVKQS